jgi:tyrosyl-tRNA synthetase
MTPILEGLDGVQKMSKSLGNAIGIKDPAYEMYGKLMSINDELMWRYWIFLTDLPQSRIDAMRAGVTAGKLHPMQAKKDLAHSITADFHTAAEADTAAEGWATQFQQKGVAEDLPEVSIVRNHARSNFTTDGINTMPIDQQPFHIPTLLVLAGLASSKGEAQRKLKENAVSVNSEKTSAVTVTQETLGDAPVLRLGKKQVRVKWSE